MSIEHEFQFETKGLGKKKNETTISFNDNCIQFSCSCTVFKNEGKACTHVLNCLDCREERLASPSQVPKLKQLKSYLSSSPLTLLAILTNPRLPKDHRYIHFLKSPDEIGNSAWFMTLLPAFNDSIDLKRTIRVKNRYRYYAWTQGSLFDFQAGSCIYDSPQANLEWRKALQQINLAIQIRTASSVDESADYLGHVKATLLRPNNSRTKLEEYGEFEGSQVDFIRFLITGSLENNILKLPNSRQIQSKGDVAQGLLFEPGTIQGR